MGGSWSSSTVIPTMRRDGPFGDRHRDYELALSGRAIEKIRDLVRLRRSEKSLRDARLLWALCRCMRPLALQCSCSQVALKARREIDRAQSSEIG
jgi:hypothetical protein